MRARGVLFAVVAWLLACASGLAACGTFDAQTGDPLPAIDGGADTALDGGTSTGDGGSPDASANEGGVHPGMVAIDTPGVGTFFIDAHEVTFGEYSVFADALRAGKATAVMPQRCLWKTTFEPTPGCTTSQASSANHPVVCADWCDAFAYCAFRGKRLCGNIGGGPVDPNIPGTQQWGVACSGASGLPYPYPNGPNGSACWTKEADAGGFPAAVETAPACEGSAKGLFDMSGNVWEWEDQCVAGMDGGKDLCIIRGGSVADPATNASCSAREKHQLDFGAFTVGFRCCAEP